MTKLQKLRLNKGLTQRDISNKTGLNYRTYQQYEQGAKKIDHARFDTILKICIVLDCDIEEILEEQTWLDLYDKYMKKEE